MIVTACKMSRSDTHQSHELCRRPSSSSSFIEKNNKNKNKKNEKKTYRFVNWLYRKWARSVSPRGPCSVWTCFLWERCDLKAFFLIALTDYIHIVAEGRIHFTGSRAVKRSFFSGNTVMDLERFYRSIQAVRAALHCVRCNRGARQTDRHLTVRETETDRDRQIDWLIQRDGDRDRQTDWLIQRDRDRQRQSDRQTQPERELELETELYFSRIVV